MTLTTPSFEIIQPHGYDLTSILRDVERAGRVSHKSEGRITEDSHDDFCKMLAIKGHMSPFEFGTIYATIPTGIVLYANIMTGPLASDPYTRIVEQPGCIHLTTNLRRIIEYKCYYPIFLHLVPPTEFHSRRITVRFHASIQTRNELRTHRSFSWMVESTRFCNYSKGRFGNSIAFATPSWLTPENRDQFERELQALEGIYLRRTSDGFSAQSAAYFLPQGTLSEFYMCGYVDDFRHFFDLRCSPSAHPDVQHIVRPLKQAFIDAGYLQY